MSGPDPTIPRDRERRALNSIRLLYLSEILDTLVAYAEGQPRPLGLRQAPDWVLESEQNEHEKKLALQQWRNAYSDELATVKAARNAVAHALKLNDDIIRDAVRVGRQLIVIARVLLGHEPYADPLKDPDAP